MNNQRELAATLVGAVIGGLAGYLVFTDRGRSVRRQIEPAIDDFTRELTSFRTPVQKATGVASEGRKLLNGATGEPEAATTFPGRPTSPLCGTSGPVN